MVVQVEVRQVVLTVAEDDQQLFVVEELSQQPSVFVVVQTVHIGVVPHLASTQRRVSVALQSDAVDRFLGQGDASCSTSLDHNVGEVTLEEDARLTRADGSSVQRYLNDFRLAIGVSREVHDLRAWLTCRHVILAVAGDSRHIEALDVVRAFLSRAIHHVVDGALVVALVDAKPQHVLAHKELLGHTYHLELSVAVEDDDIVDVGAVADVFVLLQTRADEALLTVDVELLVGLGHLRSLDGVEVAYLRQTRMVLAVLVLEEQEPLGRHLRQVLQVVVYLVNLCLNTGHQLVGFVLVELQDALHLDFQQLQDIVLRHLANHLRIIRRQALINMLADGIHIGSLFKLLVLIDTLLNENLFQRIEVQLLEQLVLTYLQLLTDEVLRTVGRVAQYVADGEELRLVVADDAAVGRDVDLAVGEGIEGVDGLV